VLALGGENEPTAYREALTLRATRAMSKRNPLEEESKLRRQNVLFISVGKRIFNVPSTVLGTDHFDIIPRRGLRSRPSTRRSRSP